MDEWTAFLAARLDEDAAAAKAAASVAGPGWKAGTYWPEDEGRTRTCVRSEYGAFLADLDEAPDYPDLATHIARHDPARVLREVEADRKLIALHAVEVRREERRAGYDEIAEGKPPVYWVDEYSCVICGWFDAEQGACETVRIRAERFSDHPDYRLHAWRL